MCIYLHTFDILPQPMAEVEILQTKFIPQLPPFFFLVVMCYLSRVVVKVFLASVQNLQYIISQNRKTFNYLLKLCVCVHACMHACVRVHACVCFVCVCAAFEYKVGSWIFFLLSTTLTIISGQITCSQLLCTKPPKYIKKWLSVLH